LHLKLCHVVYCACNLALQIEMQRRLFAAARARSLNVDALAEANVQAAYGAMQQQQHLQGGSAAAAAGGQYLQQEAMHDDEQ
jgi:post-segregation antitoxin (ccd killing protein)